VATERLLLTPSRLAKSVFRKLRVTWREQPTQHDIEAVEGNIARVGLVIRFRWLLVAAVVAFSVAGTLIYLADSSVPRAQITANMLVPAATLLFVIAYNSYYQMTYKSLGNIAILNHAQLLFDIVVISVLVHYSGGVYSWFYPMYSLIVLEAAFIFSRRRDTYIVAGAASVGYSGVIWLEWAGWWRHIPMPFVTEGLEKVAAYAAVHSLWATTVLVGSALLSLAMMERVRTREHQLEALATTDETTGLYNRQHFVRRLAAELQRARVYDRTLSVLLLDIDEFGEFNRRFGMEAGNTVLRSLATLLDDEIVTSSSSPVAEFCTIARYGGEEFAVVLPQSPGMSAEESSVATHRMAERLVTAIGAHRVDDMGVTVSIGIAMFPQDGTSTSELVASADQALFAAATLGGNRVISSDDEIGVPETAV
jgi:diguanylate cyclase (GGDEF)-like protein